MDKIYPALLLVFTASILGRPALAEPPKEVCTITLDVNEMLTKNSEKNSDGILEKRVLQGPIKMTFLFRTNLSDLNSPDSVTVPPPLKGAWIYTTARTSFLDKRQLTGIKVEPEAPAPGARFWSVYIVRPDPNDKNVPNDSTIRCYLF